MAAALRIALLGLLLAGLMGCGQSSQLSQGAGDRDSDTLPALEQLDGLRIASAVNPANIDEFSFVDSRNTSALPDGLLLTPPEDGYAWAIYRVDPPTDELVNARVLGSGDLWLMVADFGKNRWRQAALLSEGSAQSAFSTLDGYLSQQGFAYFALLTPQGGSGLIDTLQFDYEGPANLRYVAMPADGGDDSGPGTIDQPWATLQKAADSAGPDTLIIVRPGSYPGFNITQGGADGLPIIFEGGGEATINAPAPGKQVGISMESDQGIGYVTISGFLLSAFNFHGIRVAGVSGAKLHHVTVRDCRSNASFGCGLAADFVDNLTVQNCQFNDSTNFHGLMVGVDCDSLSVRGNEMSGNAFAGFSISVDPIMMGDGLQSATLIEGNIISGNGTQAMYCAALDSAILRNNLCTVNGSGIYLFKDVTACTNNIVVNNTVVQQVGTGDALLVGNDGTGNRIYNNILISPGPTGAAIHTVTSALADFTSNNNLLSNSFQVDMEPQQIFSQWQANYGQDLASQVADQPELFVDSVAGDFHLKDGSPAIGFADPLQAPAEDLEGNPRPLGTGPDSGCFERE